MAVSIEDVKSVVKLREYAENHLERMGRTFVCPNCKSGTGPNKTPAFSIKGERWHCFACGAGGDVLDLVGSVEGIDDQAEQLKRLVEEYRLEDDGHYGWNDDLVLGQVIKDNGARADDSRSETSEQEKARQRERDLIKRAQAAILTDEGAEARRMLASRGFVDEDVLDYGFGFYVDGSGNPRVLIPARDTDFYHTDRAMGTFKPKYTKPSGDVGKQPIWSKKALASRAFFLCEGPFDALSVEKCGYPAIAILGKENWTLLQAIKDQNEKGLPDTGKPIILTDNDDKGREGAKWWREHLDEAGVKYEEYKYDDQWPSSVKDPSELLIHDEKCLREILKNVYERATADGEKTSLDLFDDFAQRIRTEEYKPLKTGMAAFDSLLSGGIMRQSLMVVTAAPGTGKTALLSQITEQMAKDGQDVIFLNLEMSREYILARSISRIMASYDYPMTATKVLRGYEWTEEEKGYVEAALSSYRNTTAAHMHYNPDGCTSDLESIVVTLNKYGERAKRNGEMAPPVVLDYLHLVTTQQRMDAQEIVKQTISAMKEYAIRYNTFAIVISATNRKSNESGRQTQSSGRDSSAIEYTADVQLTLNYAALADREKKLDPYTDKERCYNANNPDDMAELMSEKPRRMVVQVVKERMGPGGGKLYLDFDAAYSKFTPARRPMGRR